MKKIYLILSAAALLFSSSCEDAIDIVQTGEVDSDILFETVDDLQSGIYYVYGMFSYSSEIGLSSIWTDECGLGLANGGQGISDGSYGFVMTSGSSFASGIFEENYDVINIANRLILAGEEITPEEGEEDTYNNIMAEAHALRAFAYFQLLTYFSPDITDDDELGVMLFDYIPNIADQLPRVTNGEVFDFINDDLDYAEQNIGDGTDVTYVTADFITAVRARMALYRENYTEAQTYAQQLINSYDLTSRTLYPYMWTDDVDGEVIFKFERTTVDATIASLWFSVDANITGSPFYEVGRSLFNELDTDDVRYDAIVQETSEVDSDYENSSDYYATDALIIGKYPGSEGINLLNDIKVFRVSEMYFIKAEAQVANGDLDGAAETLQEVVDARYAEGTAPTITFATEQAAWRGILKQRRIELAFEGFRYTDIKRLGEKAGVDLERDAMDCAINGACSLSSTSYKLTLPIPSSEMAANNNIEQNPEY